MKWPVNPSLSPRRLAAVQGELLVPVVVRYCLIITAQNMILSSPIRLSMSFPFIAPCSSRSFEHRKSVTQINISGCIEEKRSGKYRTCFAQATPVGCRNFWSVQQQLSSKAWLIQALASKLLVQLCWRHQSALKCL